MHLDSIHIKRGNYPRALEAAQQALRIDESARDQFGPHCGADPRTCRTNNKAKFREAQAMIGLGEISKGRAALESLQISVSSLGRSSNVSTSSLFAPPQSPDIAITNALHQLRLDERARTAKSQAQFSESFS